MNEDRFAELLHADESEEHEFCLGLDKRKVAKTVCAFLNGRGGRIIVGASPTREVSGLKNPLKSVEDVEAYLRESVLPTAAWSTSVETSNDGTAIVVVDVPFGTSKPYLINGQIWCRKNAATIPATPDDVSRMIEDRVRADERWERRVALGVTKDDLDLEEILRAAKEIQKSGRHRFQKSRDPLTVLNELSLYSAGQFSNASVVLFGRQPTAVFPQSAIRVTIYETDKRGKELHFDELCESHLFATLDRVIEIVGSKVGVTSDFRDDEWRRSDRPVYPFWSLREGLLNALVHRDLSTPSGGVNVSIYPDQIQIWNHGPLPEGWRVADLTKDHPSLPRNPDIAHVCFLRGFIEKLGRGTQLIATELKRFRLQKPKWESGATGTTLTFFNKQSSRRAAEKSLNQRQLLALEQLSTGDRLTVVEYVDSLGDKAVSDRTARTDLNGLIDAGLLKRRGRGKNTFYERTDRAFKT